MPVGVQSIVFSLSNVLIQSTINTYGDIVVTGNSTAANLEGFIYVSMNSIAIATTTVVGQNVGAGKVERIKKILPISLAMVSVIGITMGALANVFGEQLLSIYESGHDAVSQAIRNAGKTRLLFICIPYFLCGIMEVQAGLLRGLGYSTTAMINSLVGACGFRILWIIFVLPLRHTIEVLFLCWPISWVLVIIMHFVCYKAVKKKAYARMLEA